MSLEYLEQMQDGFGLALDRGLERRDVTLEVDGETLLLRFAGSELARVLLPPLAPLISSSRAAPAMTIDLWDSASSGIPPPPTPWGPADGGPVGAVRGHNDGGLRTVVDAGTSTLTIADLDRGRAVVWSPSAAALPVWWRAIPLRMLLGWTLAGPGRHLVHAGAVGVDQRGVLLAGSGRAGKSTTATTCIEAGMSFVADDYLLLSTGPPPRAHAVYSTARVDQRSLASLPSLSDGATAEDGEKVLFNLHELRPDQLRVALSIEAVVLPRFTGGDGSSLEAISAGTAVRALAPSTIFQETGGGAPALRVISDVLRSVPAYELRIGDDLRDVPGRIGSLLEAGA